MKHVIMLCLTLTWTPSCVSETPAPDICAGLHRVKMREGDVFTDLTKREIYLNKVTITRHCYGEKTP